MDPRFGTGPTMTFHPMGGPCVVGEVLLVAGAYGIGTPAEGQLLPIAGNSALFSVVGTMYGGNGTSDFGLPDLHGTAPNGLTYTICVNGTFPTEE
jgi:microcystin-dependent protein